MAGCGSRAARPAPGNGTSPVNTMAWVAAVVEVEREMTERGALNGRPQPGRGVDHRWAAHGTAAA